MHSWECECNIPDGYRGTNAPGKVSGSFVITMESESRDEDTCKFVVSVSARTIVPANDAGVQCR